jgi:pSer/pThr/pTyr-binding forkhead associated (FHA) protein
MTSTTLVPPVSLEGITERFDPIECLDQRALASAARAEELAPGRYLQVEGPSRALLIPLGEAPVHIGRGLSADLRLDDMSVSRRHAIILPGQSGVRLLDESSSNGTLVNGRPIQQAELHPGDTISVGRFALRFLEIQRRRAPAL